MKLQEISNAIEIIMAENKKARDDSNYIKLIENGFQCLEYINPLINASVENEKKYRKYEAGMLLNLKSQGVKGKNGEAEVLAKAEDSYTDWQHCIQLINLCYEMNNNAKKLADSLNKELRAMSSNNKQYGGM